MQDNPTILLIEDSDTQALRVQLILEDEGLAVRRVESAEEALDSLATFRPELIMVDYHLPGMQGDEFCRQFRMNKGMASVPLLILTEETHGDVERKGLESGADDYISKSLGAEGMVARVHALMRHRSKWTTNDWASKANFRKARVLAVDDSLTYLAFLQGSLEQDGYTVTTADSGEAALVLINKESFDCIVVDLIMPGIDGIELCRQFDELRQNTSLSFPILMVTGRDSNEDMMRALDAGADDFVSKSNDISIIKARIRALLRRKFLQDEHDLITVEFRNKELEILRERAAREAAQQKAELADKLEQLNAELGKTNLDLKETQAQLIQTAKMASLGELVAGIAHEINNPLSFVMNHTTTVADRLTQISGEVEPVLSETARKKWDKALDRLHDMHEGLSRVSEIVIKLRTFSRLDEGDFKTVDMRENIESTIALIRYRCKDMISLTAAHAEDSVLSCYPGPLNQVIMNLLGNAIDAIEGPGTITITTTRTEYEFIISVADDGPGVPQEIRERIFEPFFTTKPVGSGTGLGLAICYRIVQHHKGRIDVRDRCGGGAEIVITIPTNLEEETMK